MPFAQHSVQKTSRYALAFLIAAVWMVLSAAGGEMSRLAPPMFIPVTAEVITAWLLFCGFYLIARRFLTDLRPLSNVGFVRRPGTGIEFGRGLALGWGIAVALILPALLTGNLSMNFAVDGAALVNTVLSIVSLTAFALIVQLILAGLPVRMLLNATGATRTVMAVLGVAAVLSLNSRHPLLFSVLAAYLFAAAFLRTRAIWVGLGLQIGLTVGLRLLFGASSSYGPPTAGVISSYTGGPAWLTGGAYGPETSVVAVLILVAAIVVLYRVTKDYAWHYTWQPVEGAGDPVTVAPPAEHLREEAKHAAPLVQIGGIQPAPGSKQDG